MADNSGPEFEYPYHRLEKLPIWQLIDDAIHDLESNQDIRITTERRYVIGYLCKMLLSESAQQG